MAKIVTVTVLEREQNNKARRKLPTANFQGKFLNSGQDKGLPALFLAPR